MKHHFQKTDKSGEVAFEAWIAIWNEETNFGLIGIASPDLDTLEKDWNRLTGLNLDREKAQHVFIAKIP